jgi:serine/threonine protein kinase
MPEHDSDDITRSHIALAPGAKIGHYRIVEKIGAGGMGEVYLAEDTRLMRKVAIKFLPIHLAAKDDVKSRFLREAQAVAKLNHPNIVTIHDVSEYGGRPYFVMEHVEGQSLHHFAHDEPLPLDTVIDYAIQICQGIGEAHRAKIIHRDIKTSNIVIDSKGRARLLDFGLAAVAGDEKITKTGSTLGTVAYMSPEQVSGRDIDHRSDLFSFGVVLYELLAGRTPFLRDNEGATLRAIVQDVPEPLSRYRAEIPDRLRNIVEKLLEKDRELRYQTAEGVIADLKKLFYDSQQTGYQRATPVRKSKLKWLIPSAVVVLALAAALIFALRPKGERAATSESLPMIAVLPFENLGNPDDEYFADGMTEEITSRLAGINGLGVISRTSAMQYKESDKSLNEIGKELGVDYILEGSVRWAKVGGQPRVRITPQLIRVSDDRHVWADNYERELMEVFAVQADIAAQIVKQLGLTLLDSDRNELASRPTEDSRAYDYYLRGINGLRRADWPWPSIRISRWPMLSGRGRIRYWRSERKPKKINAWPASRSRERWNSSRTSPRGTWPPACISIW